MATETSDRPAAEVPATEHKGDKNLIEQESRPISVCDREVSTSLEMKADESLISADVDDPVDVNDAKLLAGGIGTRLTKGRWHRKGGMGRVDEVFDNLLTRRLIRKRPRGARRDGADNQRAFIYEARITAQLNHPNIVPLLDLGFDGERGFYYLMPWVEGLTLYQVLTGLSRNTPEIRRRFRLPGLLQVFRTVCGALAHAHGMGVVHRDLHTGQILLGAHGEVLVLDWGIAARLGGIYQAPESPDGASSWNGSMQSGVTVLKGVHGVPRFQPPERLVAEPIEADPRQDVYALGMILYVLLTLDVPLRRQSEGEPSQDYHRYVRRSIGNFVRPCGQAWAPVDAIWDDICLRCLARHPQDRYASAAELFEAVDAALSDQEEQERRQQRAAVALGEGAVAARQLQQVQDDAEAARLRRRELDGRITPQKPLEEKRPLWEAEDRELALQGEVGRRFAEVERCYELALSHDPGSTEARNSLADLYQERVRQAQEEGDLPARAYYSARLERHDDGRRMAELRSGGTLMVGGEPRGAQVRIAPLVEVERRLVPEEWRTLGTTPLESTALDAGRYQLEIMAEGRATARYAILAEAGQDLRLWPRMPLRSDIPDGFVYVPAGPCWIGGDPLAVNAVPRQRVEMSDFAMGIFPVINRDYLRFLDDLDMEEAEQRISRDLDGTPLMLHRDGRWTVPETDHHGDRIDPDYPVFAIRAEDAERFCCWASERDQCLYRLPTRDEWEYAARSFDCRKYPWGDRYEASYCWGGDIQTGKRSLATFGRCEIDRSPVGVRDLAGGVGDWLADDFAEDGSARHIGGGTWFATRNFMRLARRFGMDPAVRNSGLGFRLLLEIQSQPPPSQYPAGDSSSS